MNFEHYLAEQEYRNLVRDNRYLLRRRAGQERRRLQRIRRRERLAVLVLIVFLAILLLGTAGATKAPVSGGVEAAEPVVEDPAYDIPAQEVSAVEDAELPMTYLGNFRISHYCPCEKCCGEWADGVTATGTIATEGRTVAVDPDVIPYGSRIAVFYNDGRIVEYIAEDRGGVIKGNKLDIFVSDHGRANELGIAEACVYVVNEK